MNKFALFIAGCATGLAVLALASSFTLPEDDESGIKKRWKRRINVRARRDTGRAVCLPDEEEDGGGSWGSVIGQRQRRAAPGQGPSIVAMVCKAPAAELYQLASAMHGSWNPCCHTERGNGQSGGPWGCGGQGLPGAP
jgi:hypothetical protein